MNAVYIYYTSSWQPLADIVLSRVKDYCKKFGYDSLLVNPKIDNNGIVGYWKMNHLRSFIEHYDFIWSLDLDTLITNSIPFTSFVDNDHDIFITEDIHGINAGSWIIRNTEASKKFLDQVLLDFDAPEEQTVMKRYIDMVKVKILPHPSINSYKYSLYKDDLGEIHRTHEEGEWELGDLLLHLPGLSLGKRIEILGGMI